MSEKYYIINNLPHGAVSEIAKELNTAKSNVSKILRGQVVHQTDLSLMVIGRAQAMAAVHMFNNIIIKHGDTPLNPLKIKYES